MYYNGKQVWRIRTEDVEYDIPEDQNRWVYDDHTEDPVEVIKMTNIFDHSWGLHVPNHTFEAFMEGVVVEGDEEDIL